MAREVQEDHVAERITMGGGGKGAKGGGGRREDSGCFLLPPLFFLGTMANCERHADRYDMIRSTGPSVPQQSLPPRRTPALRRCTWACAVTELAPKTNTPARGPQQSWPQQSWPPRRGLCRNGAGRNRAGCQDVSPRHHRTHRIPCPKTPLPRAHATSSEHVAAAPTGLCSPPHTRTRLAR